MTNPNLRGPISKVERAKAQILQLATAINAFGQSHPYAIVYEPDEARNITTVRAKLTREHPELFDTLVGEILYNLRTALDHLVCRLVELNGIEDLDGVYFPFCNSAENFELPGTQKKIRKTSAKAQDMIRSYKPYRGGNDNLWMLNNLQLMEKHRKTIDIGMAPRNMNISNGVFNSGIIVGAAPAWASFDQGIEVFRLNGLEKPKQEPSIRISFNVAIGEYPEISTVPAITVLAHMASITGSIVKDFEREFFS